MPQRRLDGKTAVVTGGASGIGLATVRRFVAEGARGMGGDVDVDAVARVASELGSHGTGHRCDVSEEAEVAALFGATEELYGRLDIAFANAGLGSFAPI